MKISVFTVICPDLDLQETIDACAESGASGVEWRVREIPPQRRDEPYSFWGNHKNDLSPRRFLQTAGELKQRSEAAGLAISNIGSYLRYDSPSEEVKMIAEGTAKCGAPSFRCGPAGYSGQRHYGELFQQSVEGLGRIVEIARSFGVKVVLETHMGLITASASGTRRVAEKFSPAEIGVIHDPGNMVYEGYEQYRMGFELLGEYLSLVHVKNARWVPTARGEDGIQRWKAEWAPLAEGIADWRNIIVGLRQVGYAGFLSLEDFTAGVSTREKIRQGVQFLREVLAATEGG